MANLLPDLTAAIGQYGDVSRQVSAVNDQKLQRQKLADLYRKAAGVSDVSKSGMLSPEEVDFNAQGISSGQINPDRAMAETKADISGITNALKYRAIFDPDPKVREDSTKILDNIKKMSAAWDATDYKKDLEMQRQMQLKQFESNLKKEEIGLRGENDLNKINRQKQLKDLESKKKKEMSKLAVTQKFVIGDDMADIGKMISDYQDSNTSIFGDSSATLKKETIKGLESSASSGASDSKLNAQLYAITSKIEDKWANRFPAMWQTLHPARKKEIVSNTFWNIFNNGGKTRFMDPKTSKETPLSFDFQYSPMDTTLLNPSADENGGDQKSPSAKDISLLMKVIANPSAKGAQDFVDSFNETYGTAIKLNK